MAAAAAPKTEGDISTDFLKDYVAKGGKVVDKESGEDVSADNVDDYLKEVGGGDKEQPASRKAMSKRAADAAPDPEAEAAAKAKEDAKAKAEADKKQAAKNATIRGAIGDASQGLVDGAAPLADRIGSLSTVGGIGLLIVILTLLVFIVVQVNQAGDTRLKMLWYMVNGRVKLQGRVIPTGATSGSSSGSGTSNGVGAGIGAGIGAIIDGQTATTPPSSSGSVITLFTDYVPLTSYRGNAF